MRNGHGLKILGLAAVLGLCLALSGCYIPPDDINGTGGYPTGGGSLPFQTLAPTATVEVTPDTVVIETQNLYNYQNGGQIQTTNSVQGETLSPAESTPTPPSGSGGWSDWGTVSGATNPPEAGGTSSAAEPTPEDGTIYFETATPRPEGTGTDSATSRPQETIHVVTQPPATPD